MTTIEMVLGRKHYREHSKDMLWIAILAIATLVFLNIFIQHQLHKGISHNIELNPSESRDVNDSTTLTIENKKMDLPKEYNATKAVEVNSTLNLNLKLLGTMSNPPMAIIYDLDSGRIKLSKLKEKILGAQVVSISRDKVILERSGKRQKLFLADQNSTAGDATDFSGEIVVNRSNIRSQIGKANELLAKMEVFPVTDEFTQKLKGFRIDNVPSDSIIEDAGIKNGDILYSVQGQRIESTKDALLAFKSVKNESNIDVTLLRNDQFLTLRYKIKD